VTVAAKLVDIKKNYVLKSETVRALRGVSFDVPEGDYVAIGAVWFRRKHAAESAHCLR
jgi:hypothetical protein